MEDDSGANAASDSVSAEPVQFEFLTSSELCDSDFSVEYLIEDILVRGQHCVIGGAPKTLKTGISIDLAVSLASGKPFLGRFPVKQCRVGVISGESGGATIQETVSRVCYAKGCIPSTLPAVWSFSIPCLTDGRTLAAIRNSIVSRKLDVLIIDPTYLALMDAMTATGASNLFVMGAILRTLTEALRETGVTLILIHHVGKGAARESRKAGWQPPDLMDLSQSGFAEFARQWIMLGRIEAYEPGSGMHRLWMQCGGSAGHSGLYAVEIAEGNPKDDGGRRWEVAVKFPEEARSSRAAAAEQEREQRAADIHRNARERIVQLLRDRPDGETASYLRDRIKVRGFQKNMMPAIVAAMIDDGDLVECPVKKHTKTYDGLRLPA